MRFNLLMALGMALSLIAFSAAAMAANAPDRSPPALLYICDFYHPQDCNVNTPPPTTPFVPTVQPPGQVRAPQAGACQPPAPNSPFAFDGFKQQWQQGEAIATNFWGPTYTIGFNEPYVEGSTGFSESGPTNPGQGMRLVQYFDKGRMELTHPASGQVTNGLLASEIVKGQIQVGDNAFQPKAPPAIPIAGDTDNPSPTYAQLSTTAASLLAPTPAKPGTFVSVFIDANGAAMDGGGFAGISMTPPISAYDGTTQHNVLGVFADYRTRVGLGTIGLAISEPFRATVKVGGQSKTVLIQVFERRVLTYTASNPAAFQVEMGNIGQHYYRWRYCV